ncbi:hypothetical protein C8R44DRAFT_252742 [Mycena epipterygia]|nr:hypothetical protein C8R44DRAFT_252742 [Mycena epipterygia]
MGVLARCRGPDDATDATRGTVVPPPPPTTPAASCTPASRVRSMRNGAVVVFARVRIAGASRDAGSLIADELELAASTEWRGWEGGERMEVTRQSTRRGPRDAKMMRPCLDFVSDSIARVAELREVCVACSEAMTCVGARRYRLGDTTSALPSPAKTCPASESHVSPPSTQPKVTSKGWRRICTRARRRLGRRVLRCRHIFHAPQASVRSICAQRDRWAREKKRPVTRDAAAVLRAGKLEVDAQAGDGDETCRAVSARLAAVPELLASRRSFASRLKLRAPHGNWRPSPT